MSFLIDDDPRPCQVCNKVVDGMKFIRRIDHCLEGYFYLCMLFELLDSKHFFLCPNCLDGISKCAKAILSSRFRAIITPNRFFTVCLLCGTTKNLKISKIAENSPTQYVIRRFKGNIVAKKINLCLPCGQTFNKLNQIYKLIFDTQVITAGRYNDDLNIIMANTTKYYDPNLVVFVPDLEAAIADAMGEEYHPPNRSQKSVVRQEGQSPAEIKKEAKQKKCGKSMEEYLAKGLSYEDDDYSNSSSNSTSSEYEDSPPKKLVSIMKKTGFSPNQGSMKLTNVEAKASGSSEKENKLNKSPLKVIRPSTSTTPTKVLADINSDKLL